MFDKWRQFIGVNCENILSFAGLKWNVNADNFFKFSINNIWENKIKS